ncbi:MAG: penicillin acylase family protein [Candidatus Obscuribacterales bacterium]|nr:penicillin acylase family protein [Candidatus Obscuribacterales bacterium]
MLKVVLALVSLLILLAPALTWFFAQRPVPSLEGLSEISGLQRPVLLRYDSRAIPYIKADSDEDLYAAQGYVTARERMFQMDILRRTAEGRLAQIFGINALSTDRLMRTIGFERLALDELKYLSAESKLALDAYCRGVNAYLAESSDKLPFEFSALGYRPESWRPVDTLALMKYLSYELDESWKLDELRWQITNKVGDNLAARLFNDNLAVSSWSPELAANKISSSELKDSKNKFKAQDRELAEKLSRKLAQLPEFMPKKDPSWGSSAWVLSPAFSKSGAAMLAGDKHSALSCPVEYFISCLVSPNLHVAGACIPGVPGVLFGRNKMIAWSAASMHADVQDLFVEHFASEQENKYKTLSKIETASEFREAIPVRFGKDVEHKITITRHGPVLLRDKESAITLSWSGFENRKPWLNTISSINRAANWTEFNQSLSKYSASPQLFVYADKRGNIGCHAAGIIPVRAGGGDGCTMTEGWLAKGEWVSSVPYDSLPQSYMPSGSQGRISGDFCVAAGQRLASSSYLWGHQWSPPYRANRLALSLPKAKTAQKLDLFDFNAYQGDELNMLAGYVVSELKKSIDANKSIDASQSKAMELMQHWDFYIKRDSAAAACYESFVGTLARRLLEPKLGRDLTNQYFQNWPLWITFVEDYLRHKPKDLLPSEERSHDTFMLTTFAKANTRLKLLLKSEQVENWTWEKAHQGKFRALGLSGMKELSYLSSVLDIPAQGLGGDADCLNACDVDRVPVDGIFPSKNGPCVRLLIDLADDDVIYGNLALGQSGHFFSPYRQDQLKSWLRADPLPIAFSEAQIDKQCRQKFYLSAPGYR